MPSDALNEAREAQPYAELRPCPFCGGEASDAGHARYSRPLADTRWEDGSEITECFFVNCVKCGIDNGRPGLVGGYQTKAEAIERWNTRADSTLRDRCIALEGALEPFDEAFGEDCDDDFADDTPVVVTIGKRTTLYGLSLGDFRRARATLSGTSK